LCDVMDLGGFLLRHTPDFTDLYLCASLILAAVRAGSSKLILRIHLKFTPAYVVDGSPLPASTRRSPSLLPRLCSRGSC
jgi:hypothetical protein